MVAWEDANGVVAEATFAAVPSALADRGAPSQTIQFAVRIPPIVCGDGHNVDAAVALRLAFDRTAPHVNVVSPVFRLATNVGVSVQPVVTPFTNVVDPFHGAKATCGSRTPPTSVI